MRSILSVSIMLIGLYGCKTNNITLQTYKTIDSSVGNYVGNWTYMHHTWQNHILTTKVDSTYTDTIAVSKVNQDSLGITSKMNAYRYKFDALSNTYSYISPISSYSLIISYTIDVVSHKLTAAGDIRSNDNAGNADTIVYQFNGKR